MRAIIYTRYGSPDVLQLVDVEKPTPGEGQVLVKVHAASVNPADLSISGGIARTSLGLLKPKDPRVGIDIAGQVEAVGPNVTQFKAGDAVFGGCKGSFAEYALARENRLASKPANITFEQAAAVPVAALTALQGLRDTGHIQPGQKVLVNGAFGGVGTFAVQISKSYGTEVTGVCSTRNLELVNAIGADHVIDYTQDDFTQDGQRYDLIYDAVGNHSVSDYLRALSPNGTCAIAGYTSPRLMLEHLFLGPLRSKNGGKKVGFMGIAKITPEDLAVLKELLEAGKIVPVIDRRYPLSETAEALRYLATKHARGKVIVNIAE